MTKYVYHKKDKLTIPYEGLQSYWKSIKGLTKILGRSDELNIDDVLHNDISHYIPFRVLDGALFPHFEQCVGGIEPCSHSSYKNNTLYIKTMIGSIDITTFSEQDNVCSLPVIGNSREFSITKIKGYYASDVVSATAKFPNSFYSSFNSKQELEIPMSKKIYDLISVKSNTLKSVSSTPLKFIFSKDSYTAGIEAFKNSTKSNSVNISPSSIKLRYEVTKEHELCMKAIGTTYINKANDSKKTDFLITLNPNAANEVINLLSDTKNLTFRITEAPSSEHFIEFTLNSRFANAFGRTLEIKKGDINTNNVVEIMLSKNMTPIFDDFIKQAISVAAEYYMNDTSISLLDKTQILSGCALYID